MECPTIDQVEFDDESREAINDIRRRANLAEVLTGALAVGTLATIFSSRRPPKVAEEIRKTDFQAFAEAVHSLPDATQAVIEREAGMQYLRVFRENDREQMRFWKAIYDGCQIE